MPIDTTGGIGLAAPWWIAGAVLLAATGASAVVLKRRTRPGDALTVEQLMELSDVAAESGRYQDALEWNLKAQALLPLHPRLKSDEGFFRASTGDVEAALAAYSAASALGGDGEPDFLAASLLVSVGQRDLAAPYLARALERTPTLAFEVLDDPAFGPSLEDPAVKAAVDKALLRS